MFLLFLVLPFVCTALPTDQKPECPPLPEVTCDEGEVVCRGGEDQDGCPLGDYCVTEADFGNCPVICSEICKEGEIPGQGGVGPDGCPREDYCAKPSDNCPALCNQIECKDGEERCPGQEGPDGCQIKDDYCDPTGMCGN